MGRLQPHTTRAGASRPRWPRRCGSRRPRRSRVRGSRGPGLPRARSPRNPRSGRDRGGRRRCRARPPARPVRLVDELGHQHLRDSCQRGGLRRARAAVVHDGGDAREQRLVVDLADDETALLGVGQREVGPASAENDAPPMRAGRLDRHPAKGSKKRGSDSATRPSPTASRRSYRSGWILTVGYGRGERS